MSEPLYKHHVDDVGNEGRDVTTVNVLDLDIRDEEAELLLSDLIADLQDALNSIPEEFRPSAVVRLHGYGDYVSMSGNVEFKRPETDAEMADRKRWLASLDREREDRDRHEFERLKSKFKTV